MKLGELAELKQGINIPSDKIHNGPRVLGPFFQYMRQEDFLNKTSNSFVSEKDLRKSGVFTKSLILSYGDYILYAGVDAVKLFRYDSPNGYTIPDDRIVIIRLNFSIIQEFFGYEENKKYFLKEVQRLSAGRNQLPSIEQISDIEIMTNNILELKDVNKADILGIRKPIAIDSLPFNILQKPITIDKLLKRIKHNELLLDTEFQRRPGLWDIGVKSRFIESMIIRLPVPAFYFDGSNDDEWLVIDGLQRLSAIYEFVEGKYGLTQLDFLPELDGLDFGSLTRSFQRNIEEYEVYAYILQKGTPKGVTYKIFKNINTSALKLEPQEIRHAINPGIPALLLKRISENKWFRERVPVSDRMRDRMEDREIVLRYLAFQRSHYRQYKPTIVEFLDVSMVELYETPEHQQVSYSINLEKTLQKILDVFETPPFSRSCFDTERRTYVHNNILFELLTFGFSKINLSVETPPFSLNTKKGSIVEYFKLKPDKFWDYDSAYTQEGLIRRFEDFEIFIINLFK